jgi:hypothetical protein
MQRFEVALLSLVAASVFFVFPTPGIGGSWKFEVDQRGHPTLSFSESGKVQFLVGCGRAFGLHAKYPGKAKKSGTASITIANARKRLKLPGEFEEPDAEDATNFVQWDLGFSRQDPELFGKRWSQVQSRLLDLIGSGETLTISSGKDNYRLPPVDVSNWKTPLAKCGD